MNFYDEDWNSFEKKCDPATYDGKDSGFDWTLDEEIVYNTTWDKWAVDEKECGGFYYDCDYDDCQDGLYCQLEICSDLCG